MKTLVFNIEVEQEEDGRWSATIPVLAGCATWGYTKEEAIDSLKEATQAYLEVMLEQNAESFQEVAEKATLLPEDVITVTV